MKHSQGQAIIAIVLSVGVVVAGLVSAALVMSGAEGWMGGGGTNIVGTGNSSIVKIAQAERDAGVHEIPNNSNRGDGVDKYGNSGNEWCSYFATWVLKQAGLNVPSMGGSQQTYHWFENNQTTFQDPSQAAPGDVVVWSRGGAKGHIGIVESNNGSTITTIEGNSSNAVRRRSFTYPQLQSRFSLLGFGRMKGYKESQTGGTSGPAEEITGEDIVE